MLKHIPNILTSLRITLVPVFSILYILDMRTPALVVFVLAEITDVLDGFIARRFGCISNVGKALDPLADKITLIGILLCLFISGRIHPYLLALLVARELLMICGGVVLWWQKLTFSADRYGKFTTVLFFTAAVLLYPWHDIPALIYTGSGLLLLSLASSIITSVHYVRRYIHMRNAYRIRAK